MKIVATICLAIFLSGCQSPHAKRFSEIIEYSQFHSSAYLLKHEIDELNNMKTAMGRENFESMLLTYINNNIETTNHEYLFQSVFFAHMNLFSEEEYNKFISQFSKTNIKIPTYYRDFKPN